MSCRGRADAGGWPQLSLARCPHSAHSTTTSPLEETTRLRIPTPLAFSTSSGQTSPLPFVGRCVCRITKEAAGAVVFARCRLKLISTSASLLAHPPSPCPRSISALVELASISRLSRTPTDHHERIISGARPVGWEPTTGCRGRAPSTTLVVLALVAVRAPTFFHLPLTSRIYIR